MCADNASATTWGNGIDRMERRVFGALRSF